MPGTGARAATVASTADLKLVACLLDGDEDAFASLVRRHHATMVGVAAAYVGGDRAVAEEVAGTESGLLDDVLTEENLSKTFAQDLELTRSGDRDHCRIPGADPVRLRRARPQARRQLDGRRHAHPGGRAVAAAEDTDG